MECKYQIIKEDCVTSFNPQYRRICTRSAGDPPLPACNKDSCTYFQRKLEEELRKNPPPKPGFRYCPYMRSRVQCSVYLNSCCTCGLNPAVKEQREKERAEQKKLKEESKLSYKIKRFFKKERES